MVNFRDPDVVRSDARANMKLSHTVCGLYIWEFFTHLDYEWSVIRGHRPYRWTIWIYSTTRLAMLLAVIIDLVALNVTAPTNCKLWMIFQSAFAYMTFSFSSLLIVLRIIAIWNKNKFVVAFAVVTWLTDASFLIEGIITRIRAEWVHNFLSGFCGPPNVKSNKLAITAMLVTDVALLFTMIIGLLRLRHSGGGRFELGRLLWKQGVIYFFVATIVEITPVVFLFLDLNAVLNLMFLMPALITLSNAATRMHRSLADFGFSHNIVKCSDNPQRINHPVLNAGWTTTIPLPPSQLEVAVHTSYEHWQSSASQTGHCMLSDVQFGDRLQGSKLDDDVESGAEK